VYGTEFRFSGKTGEIREKIFPMQREISIERAQLMTESYKKTEGEPTIIRRAKAFRHILSKIKIDIASHELIVGNRSTLPRAGIAAPECSVEWLDRELDSIHNRDQEPFFVTEDNKKVLRAELFPYWRRKNLQDEIEGVLPSETKLARVAKVFTLNQTTHNQGHILPNVEKWLKEGIDSLHRKAVHKMKFYSRTKDQEKSNFYKAVDISLRGASEFILRYATLAESKMLQARGKERKRLGGIMRNCKYIADKPPHSFYQAVQSLWFLFVMLHTESIGSSFSPGRLDQYLYPFYINDLKEGRITEKEALTIIEHLWLKFNEIVLLREAEEAKYFAGFPIGFNVALGGQNENGDDATNDLSYICLEASANLRMPQPNLSIRLHHRTPDNFLRAVSRVISLGFGMPQLFNDEIIIPALLNRGIEPKDARNYAIIGCVELGIPGRSLGLSDAALFNLPRLLELVINSEENRSGGKEIMGLKREGRPLDSYENLEEDLDELMQDFIRRMVLGCNVVDQAHARLMPTPFLSSVIEDCMEKGVDVSEGGAKYNFTGPQGVGIANLADSLIAIKEFVYQKRQITLKELRQILSQNFEGRESIRQRLLNYSPKFGNDSREVDEVARKWARRYCKLVAEYRNPRGGSYQPGLYTVSAHVPLGLAVGATPDGRLAKEPLADGGISPVRGRDRKGPTAVLKSVSKIDQLLASNGTLLNLKFHPTVFDGDDSFEKFSQFLRGFVRLRVMHVQFNVVSADTLREAKRNPEAFRGLVVRVAGYSAYFVELNESLQDDIIARTEHRRV